MLAGEGAAIDTTTAAGKLVFGIFAALAEFERALIVERTKAGIAAARARGRNGGGPFKMTAAIAAPAPASDGVHDRALSRFRLLRPVLESGVSVPALAGTSGVPVPTLRRWLRLYRLHGMACLQCRARSDIGGRRRLAPELAGIIGVAARSLFTLRPRAASPARPRTLADPVCKTAGFEQNACFEKPWPSRTASGALGVLCRRRAHL